MFIILLDIVIDVTNKNYNCSVLFIHVTHKVNHIYLIKSNTLRYHYNINYLLTMHSCDMNATAVSSVPTLNSLHFVVNTGECRMSFRNNIPKVD